MAPKESEWDNIAQQRAVEKRTHVSFPQSKYPSLRDEPIRDPIQWLEGKAMDDGAEGFWRVHDKLYDFTSFMQRHPGGEEWLELTKGTDITEAFEAHHINPTTQKLLDKYYVRDANTPRNSPFTFNDDGFYRTLKKAVYEELKKIPKDVSKTADRITDGLFVSLLCSSAMAASVKNYYAAAAWYVFASVNLALLTVACHNYIHRRTNWRMYLFNMSMSYRDFRVSHVISHHLYTNTLMDLEISSLEPVLFFNPRKDKPMHARMGFITELFFFPFIFLLSFMKRFLSVFFRKGFFKRHYRWHDAIGFLLPLTMWIASGAPILHVLYTWLWINCTGSLIFYSIGTNAAHHHPQAIKDGDKPRDFRVSHVISHHLYTNTLMDLEISSLEPVLFFNPRKDKPMHARMGFITELFFFPFIFLLSFMKRFLSVFFRKGFFKRHYRWHDAIGFLLPLTMWIASGAPILHVLYTWLWINCTGSLIFYSIGTNAAHHHPQAIKDGDKPRNETPDWGEHQVEALLDRKDVNGNIFAVVVLFGDHALHHMFPTLDHAVLRYLHPIFIEHCEKFKANYRVSTQFQMVLGQIKECMRTEFREK